MRVIVVGDIYGPDSRDIGEWGDISRDGERGQDESDNGDRSTKSSYTAMKEVSRWFRDHGTLTIVPLGYWNIYVLQVSDDRP
jgi:hypothetical protein